MKHPYRSPAEIERASRIRYPIPWISTGMWLLGWGACFAAAFWLCMLVRGDEWPAWGLRASLLVMAFGGPFGLKRFAE